VGYLMGQIWGGIFGGGGGMGEIFNNLV